jgi:tRNA-splicing ligase RtcB (3'-phosphate/5'-hydroxy nucleic acid ligase)
MIRMEIFDNQIPVFGQADDRTLNQIRVCARTADKVALMPDNHVGYGVPIGGVVAYKNAISPTGVGYDIGCGNKAVRVDMPGSELRSRIAEIMDDVWSVISFGVGRKNNERVDHALFDDQAWRLKAISPLKEMARNQLGTVGSGNHYVDLFTDEEDRVWIGVHFGSRGLGHKTATHFLKAAGASDGMDVEPCVLPTDSDLGADYLQAMRLAGDYAYAGRDWVCARVAEILGAPIVET